MRNKNRNAQNKLFRAPLLRDRLLLWEHYERSSHKGYITRSENINGIWYDHLSAGVEEAGLRIYYIRSQFQDRPVETFA